MLKYNVLTKQNKIVMRNETADCIAEELESTKKEIQRAARKGFLVNRTFYIEVVVEENAEEV